MPSPRHIQVVAFCRGGGSSIAPQHQRRAHSDDSFIFEALLTHPRLRNAVYDPWL